MQERTILTANRLSWFGLVPFMALSVLGAFNVAQDLLLGAFLVYSAVILSFLGGIHWGLIMADKLDRPDARLIFCMAPSLVGWAAVAWLAPMVALLVLAAAFLLWLNYDLRHLTDSWYEKMRRPITFVVVGTHLIWFIVMATAARAI
ncbi:MAG: DUF3429 domain-containing protein [Idiomarina sp.]|nr:DUF3429 domain-containing protein [Idiomarina sp.]